MSSTTASTRPSFSCRTSRKRERVAFRAKFAAPEEKIIFFVGRMVREKGVQVLIEALPKIRWGYHDAKLLIVGGGQKDHLYNLASYLGMERHVYFPGFVPDEELMKIYQIIDIACFPSLYEPFGIVALEAMAAKVPGRRLRRRRTARGRPEQRHGDHDLRRQPQFARRRHSQAAA